MDPSSEQPPGQETDLWVRSGYFDDTLENTGDSEVSSIPG